MRPIGSACTECKESAERILYGVPSRYQYRLFNPYRHDIQRNFISLVRTASTSSTLFDSLNSLDNYARSAIQISARSLSSLTITTYTAMYL